jgi:2-keto-3-deoxy-L-rhamnonate aldolase RhmA
MLPAIESPEAAAEAVSHCRYPPRGVRGAAHPIVRASAKSRPTRQEQADPSPCVPVALCGSCPLEAV